MATTLPSRGSTRPVAASARPRGPTHPPGPPKRLQLAPGAPRAIEQRMNPITFSNAMVGAVGAYAEVVAEQARIIEQLQAALRQPRPTKPTPAPGSPAQAVIDVARELLMQTTDTGIAGHMAKLGGALAAFDRAGET